MTVKQYNIIYADPPWEYFCHMNGAASKHYQTMDIKSIKDMRPYIDTIAAPDCALFMWYTGPQMAEAIDVARAWGFTVITTVFTWVKKTKNDKFHVGNGWYTRGNPEYVLLAKRGKITPIRHDITNLQIARIRGHSVKPDTIRRRIVELLGPLPRIELFARGSAAGWDYMGDEFKPVQPLEMWHQPAGMM